MRTSSQLELVSTSSRPLELKAKPLFNHQTLQGGTRVGSDVPVITLGPGITALGVVRAVARKGIPVYSVCPGDELLKRSRWYRPVPHSGRAPGYSELAEFLESLALPRAVLMPCSDDWAKAVAALPESIADRFPTSISPIATLELFTDKWNFAQMLEAEGLPHPETSVLESMAGLRALPEASLEGRFLKPIDSQEFNRRHQKKALIVKNKREALDLMDVGEAAGRSDFPIMLQEYIPGPPTNHYFVDGFVDRDGVIRALFARQRLRMYPPLLGNSTLMVTVGLERVQGAIDTIRAMFERVPYRGVFSAEFKFDERDGLFKIIEVNARPWWYVEFATRCGVDVCHLAHRDALGLNVETLSNYPLGRRCVYVPNDFKTYRPRTAREIPAWIQSWLWADEAIFCWDDPGPTIAGSSKTVVTAFRKLVRRIVP